ncbi:HAD family hydrolase [Coralliovum pocilloporae]|uniref:HAD family hydrolase n=1 Tax=Coralliovum pocilloporae TaxID=3066369 RepID=UPI003307A8C8
MDISHIKAVLFDKDGTLLDFDQTWGPATAAVIMHLTEGNAELAGALAEAVGFVLDGGSFLSDSILLGGYTEDYAGDWAGILDVKADAAFVSMVDGLYGRFSVDHAQALPGVVEGLDQLRSAGLPLGIATNDSEANAKAHADAMNIADRMTLIMGYDSGHGGKPQPGMVLAFAAHLGLKPEEIAMVGDTMHDIHAARNAGALAVGIGTGTFGSAPLEADANLIVQSLPELSAMFG